jgi:diguanylate cyclase (GGDEF)-like protein
MSPPSVQALLLLTHAVLYFALLLFAFRARHTLGLAPLYVLLGVAEGIKFFTAGAWFVTLPWLGNLAPPSIILFTAALAMVLLVYVREDATAARQIAWGLIIANIGGALLILMLVVSARHGADVGTLPIGLDIGRTLARMSVGTLLLFIDIVAALVAYNLLTRLALPFVLRAGAVLTVVLIFDTLIYQAIIGGGTGGFLAETRGHIVAKVLVAWLYVLLMWLYLRTAEEDTLSQWIARRADRDLFAVLTYRERFERLAQQVIRDPLTGAFNRLYLDTRLAEQIDLERRRQTGVAVLMIDIDHFKRVNDEHGHATGDDALKHVARLISTHVRRGDIVCRYGGEEFAVILPGAKRKEAVIIAHHVCVAVRNATFMRGTTPIPITITIGVAAAPVDGRDAPAVLAAADGCLYAGKKQGRNRVVCPDSLEPTTQM